jgi:5-methylcytosine-specific restriction endonuclease McrA
MLPRTVLMLNASYEPLNIISWQKAIRLIYLEKADVVEEYDIFLRSPSTEIFMPAVIRLKLYVNPKRTRLIFSKWNMYIRDEFICQYCGKICDTTELTKDHIIPKSLGGDSSWDNCVTCCYDCNNKKGCRTPEQAKMKLLKKPVKPKEGRIGFKIKKRKKSGIPNFWVPYLPKESQS